MCIKRIKNHNKASLIRMKTTRTWQVNEDVLFYGVVFASVFGYLCDDASICI